MSKALLVDTSFSALPLYRALTSIPLEVHVVGGNDEDALAKSASSHIHLDYSNSENLKALIRELDASYLVPGCNDLSYKTCASIGGISNFPGIDSSSTTETINNKREFRLYSQENGLPTPKLLTDRTLSFPAIVKPVDAYSGRGVSVVKSKESLSRAIDIAIAASSTSEYIIEEFWDGQLFSHSAFIEDGHIIVDFIVREDSTASPFAVDTSCLIHTPNEKILNDIRLAAQKIVDSLSLCDGLLHTQFIVADSKIVLIEVTRRCPGDLYSMLIEHSTGFPYALAYTLPFLGQKVSQLQPGNQSNWITRHTISTPHTQTLNNINFHETILIKQMVPLSVSGDKLRDAPKGRAGILFLESRSKAEHDTLYQNILRHKLYTIG